MNKYKYGEMIVWLKDCASRNLPKMDIFQKRNIVANESTDANEWTDAAIEAIWIEKYQQYEPKLSEELFKEFVDYFGFETKEDVVEFFANEYKGSAPLYVSFDDARVYTFEVWIEEIIKDVKKIQKAAAAKAAKEAEKVEASKEEPKKEEPKPTKPTLKPTPDVESINIMGVRNNIGVSALGGLFDSVKGSVSGIS